MVPNVATKPFAGKPKGSYSARLSNWRNTPLTVAPLLPGYKWDSDERFIDLMGNLSGQAIEFCRAMVLSKGNGVRAVRTIHPTRGDDTNYCSTISARLQKFPETAPLIDYLTELHAAKGGMVAPTDKDLEDYWVNEYQTATDPRAKRAAANKIQKARRERLRELELEDTDAVDGNEPDFLRIMEEMLLDVDEPVTHHLATDSPMKDGAFIKMYDSLDVNQLARLKEMDAPLHEKLDDNYLRARSMRWNGFWFLLVNVIRNPVLYEPLHKPIATRLMRWKKFKKLFLLPRGHVKSNIITVGFTVWLIVQNVNERILIGSHKDKDAEKFLRGVKAILLNKRFMRIFPHVRRAMEDGKPEVWNNEAIKMERTSTAIENTVETMGIKSEITGRHFSWIINDDLVTRKNVNTTDQIKDTKEFHELIQSLLDPGAREIVLGTRYDYSDEYGRIIEDPELSKEYEIFVLPVAKKEGVIHEFMSGNIEWRREHDFEYLIYPTRYTFDDQDYRDPDGVESKHRKSLPALFRQQGSRTYANQYDLLPHDKATAAFPDGSLHVVRGLPTHKNLKYFRVGDLSSETEAAAKDSYTAILTGAIDPNSNLFITHIFWGTKTPKQICDELLRGQNVTDEQRPIRVGLEKGPYERAIMPWLKTEMQESETYIPIHFLPVSQAQKSKDERIYGLQSWFENGRVHILESCPHRELLEEEMDRFPNFNRKDILDALAQFPHIMFPGQAPDERPVRPKIDFAQARKDQFARMAVDGIFDPCAPEPYFIGDNRTMSPSVRMR